MGRLRKRGARRAPIPIARQQFANRCRRCPDRHVDWVASRVSPRARAGPGRTCGSARARHAGGAPDLCPWPLVDLHGRQRGHRDAPAWIRCPLRVDLQSVGRRDCPRAGPVSHSDARDRGCVAAHRIAARGGGAARGVAGAGVDAGDHPAPVANRREQRASDLRACALGLLGAESPSSARVHHRSVHGLCRAVRRIAGHRARAPIARRRTARGISHRVHWQDRAHHQPRIADNRHLNAAARMGRRGCGCRRCSASPSSCRLASWPRKPEALP